MSNSSSKTGNKIVTAKKTGKAVNKAEVAQSLDSNLVADVVAQPAVVAKASKKAATEKKVVESGLDSVVVNESVEAPVVALDSEVTGDIAASIVEGEAGQSNNNDGGAAVAGAAGGVVVSQPVLIGAGVVAVAAAASGGGDGGSPPPPAPAPIEGAQSQVFTLQEVAPTVQKQLLVQGLNLDKLKELVAIAEQLQNSGGSGLTDLTFGGATLPANAEQLLSDTAFLAFLNDLLVDAADFNQNVDQSLTFNPITLTTTGSTDGVIEGGKTGAGNDRIVANTLYSLHNAFINAGGGNNTLEVDARGFATPRQLQNIQTVIVNNAENVFLSDLFGANNANNASGIPNEYVDFLAGIADIGTKNTLDLGRANEITKLIITESDADAQSLNILNIKNYPITRLEGGFENGVTLRYGQGIKNVLDLEFAGVQFTGGEGKELVFAHNVSNVAINVDADSQLENVNFGQNLRKLTVTGDGLLEILDNLGFAFGTAEVDASENTGGIRFQIAAADVDADDSGLREVKVTGSRAADKVSVLGEVGAGVLLDVKLGQAENGINTLQLNSVIARDGSTIAGDKMTIQILGGDSELDLTTISSKNTEVRVAKDASVTLTEAQVIALGVGAFRALDGRDGGEVKVVVQQDSDFTGINIATLDARGLEASAKLADGVTLALTQAQLELLEGVERVTGAENTTVEISAVNADKALKLNTVNTDDTVVILDDFTATANFATSAPADGDLTVAASGAVNLAAGTLTGVDAVVLTEDATVVTLDATQTDALVSDKVSSITADTGVDGGKLNVVDYNAEVIDLSLVKAKGVAIDRITTVVDAEAIDISGSKGTNLGDAAELLIAMRNADVTVTLSADQFSQLATGTIKESDSRPVRGVLNKANVTVNALDGIAGVVEGSTVAQADINLSNVAVSGNKILAVGDKDVVLTSTANLGSFEVTLETGGSLAFSSLAQISGRKVTGPGEIIINFDVLPTGVTSIDMSKVGADVDRVLVSQVLAQGRNLEELLTNLKEEVVIEVFNPNDNFENGLVPVDRQVEVEAFGGVDNNGEPLPLNVSFDDLQTREFISTLTVTLGGETLLGDINLANVLPADATPTAEEEFQGLTIVSGRIPNDEHPLAPDNFSTKSGDELPDATNTVGDLLGTNAHELLSVTLDTRGTATLGTAALTVGTIRFSANNVAGEDDGGGEPDTTADLIVRGNQNVTIESITRTGDVTAVNIDNQGTGTVRVTGASPAAAVDGIETLSVAVGNGGTVVLGTAGDATKPGINSDTLSTINITGNGTVDLGLIDQVDGADFTINAADAANVSAVIRTTDLAAGGSWTFTNVDNLLIGSDVDLLGTIRFNNTNVVFEGPDAVTPRDLTGVNVVFGAGNYTVAEGNTLKLTVAQLNNARDAGSVFIGGGTLEISGDATDAAFGENVEVANVDFSAVTIVLQDDANDAIDVFLGGEDSDIAYTVTGTEGFNDFVFVGSKGDQTVNTFGGNDQVLTFGGGNDTINVGTGDDSVASFGGNDVIELGDGNNSALGGDGNDSITSGSGADSITGDAGADTINSGAGDDLLLVQLDPVNGVEADVVNTGEGLDVVRIAGSTGAENRNIRVTFTSADVGNGSVTDGDDNDAPSNTPDLAYAGQEDGGLAIRLEVENTSGQVTGEINGPSATQVARYDDEGILFVSNGEFTFDVRNLPDGKARGSDFDNVLFGTVEGDNFNATDADTIRNTILRNDINSGTVTSTDNFYVNAGEGNDVVTGGSGNDFIVGGKGDDVLRGNGGVDTLFGTGGNDVFVVSGSDNDQDDDIQGGDGDSDALSVLTDTNFVLDGGVADLDNPLGGISSIELVTLAADADLVLSSSELVDNSIRSVVGTVRTKGDPLFADPDPVETLTIEGNNRDTAPVDEIISLAGIATVTNARLIANGNGGEDVITGSAFGDALNGGNGADTLTGAAGGDAQTGGEGNDVFIVNGTADVSKGESYGGDGGSDTLRVTADTDFTGVIDVVSIETITLLADVDTTFSPEAFNGNGVVAVNGTGDNGGETVTVNGTSDDETTKDTVEGNDLIDLSRVTLDLNDITGVTVNAGGGDDDIRLTINGADTVDGGAGKDAVSMLVDTKAGFDGDIIRLGTEVDDSITFAAPIESEILVSFISKNVGNGEGDFNALPAVSLQLQSVGNNGDTKGITGGVSRIDDEGVSLTGARFNVIGLVADGSALDSKQNRGVFDEVVLGTKDANTYDFSAETDAYYVNAGDGADTVSGGSGNDFFVGLAGADTLVGGEGNNSLLGGGGADSLVGGTGADSIDGGDDDDIIAGGNGNNTLLGGAGADSISGGTGNDSIDAGAGDDTIVVGAGTDTYIGGDGKDTVQIGASFDDTSDDQLQGVEIISLTAADLTVDFGSQKEALTINGFATSTDKNTSDITGGDGNDTITTAAGADAVLGGKGDDSIATGSGDDVITGGAGNDTMTGGGGSDTFVLPLGADGLDVVTDFTFGASATKDVIDLFSEPTVNGTKVGATDNDVNFARLTVEGAMADQTLASGFNNLIGVTAATATAADVAAALQNGDGFGFDLAQGDVVYVALAVTDGDAATTGNQTGLVVAKVTGSATTATGVFAAGDVSVFAALLGGAVNTELLVENVKDFVAVV